MKAFLLLLDGAVAALSWLITLVVTGFCVYGYFWDSMTGKEAIWILLGMFAFTFSLGALYRLFTLPLRTELIRLNGLEGVRANAITRDELESMLQQWHRNVVLHVLFGSRTA